MSYFICLIRPSGAPVTERDTHSAIVEARRKGLAMSRWTCDGCFAAMAVGTPLDSSPAVVSHGGITVVGSARLDNRADLLPELGGRADVTDLEVVRSALRHGMADGVGNLVGDFAFAYWDSVRRTFVAARDPLGVRHLFWASFGPDLLAVSSHGSLLARGDSPSHDFIARYFAGTDRGDLTIYEGVRGVPAGTILRACQGKVTTARYWSAENVSSGITQSPEEYCDEFKELFQKAVSARLPKSGSTWAELSGGLDTSSIIMTAEHLRRAGRVPTKIAATVTYSDTLGGGDESEYVRAVVAASALANHEIGGHWPWRDDGSAPPETEAPGPSTLFWTRERLRDQLLRSSGALVLLGGGGGDYLFGASTLYVADWISRGRLGAATRELVRMSAVNHQSFWSTVLENGVLPFLPVALSSRFASAEDWQIPSWITPAFRRRYEMESIARSQRVRGVNRSGVSKYRRAFENRVSTMALASAVTSPSVEYERRYPFLHRPLVEFALRLPPPEGAFRPLAGKAILRTALRGVLPELVRTRISKGSVGSRMLWSLEHERALIESMLDNSMLAQLGCVEPGPLRRAYSEARLGRSRAVTGLFRTLAMETWLRIRSGRWPVRAARRSTSTSSSTFNLREVV